MNSSDLTNYTVWFIDLSRIMKNLRNAFIYTASTQQRNGNFQQWLPYSALCLGKATPRHCILETMRPRAWARSSSHYHLGRSLPAALPLPAVPQPPERLSMYNASHKGSIPSQSSPWVLGGHDCFLRAAGFSGLPPGMDALEHPSDIRRCGTPTTCRDYIMLYRTLYIRTLHGPVGEGAAQFPSPIAQDRLQTEI